MPLNTELRPSEIDPNVGLAAERTLLAWIRTGLAMMGFGFVVARFELFLREMAATEHVDPPQTTGVSFWIGAGLIALGVVVLVLSGIQHILLLRCLARGASYRVNNFSLSVILTLLLAVLGVVKIVYLLISTN